MLEAHTCTIASMSEAHTVASMLEAHTIASMFEAHTIASMLEAHTIARLHSLSQPYGLGVIGEYPVPSGLLNLQSSKKRWMKRGDQGRKERREEERGGR